MSVQGDSSRVRSSAGGEGESTPAGGSARWPTWAWLALLVGGSIALRFTLALAYPGPWILDDEILYSEIAQGLAAGGGAGARTVATPHWNLGYPLLIAPLFALFEGRLEAYTATKLVNSIVMSLAAIPAYLLARRVVRRPLALLAAALTLAVPSMIYTAGIMTENAFYPAFLWCALSFTRALERPSLARQLAALACVALASLIRPQALVLLPALPTAVFLQAVLAPRDSVSMGTRRRRRPVIEDVLGAARSHLAVLFVALAALLALGLAWLAGADLAHLLGPNAGLDYPLARMWQRLPERILLHLAELDLYLGLLPFAAFLMLLAPGFLAGKSDKSLSVFVSVSLALTLWTLLSVGAFTAYVVQDRIEERNLFFAAPFFFIALLAWVEDRPPTSWWMAACCVLGAALPWALSFDSYSLEGIGADTLALVALLGTGDALGIRAGLGPAALVLAALGAASLLVLPRRLAVLAPAVVLGGLMLSNLPVHRATVASSQDRLAAGVPPERVDWVDQAVGADARVAAIWLGGPSKLALWQSGFFNRSVGEVFALFAPYLDRLGTEALRVDPASGELLDQSGSPVRFEYVLAPASLVLDAAVVARDAPRSMVLYEARGPVRARTMTTGIWPDGWSEPEFSFTAVGCLPGLLSLDFFSDPGLFHTPQTIAVSVRGKEAESRILQPGERWQLALPFPSQPSGPCRAAFTVSPSAVPAEEMGLADPRRLGVLCEKLVFQEACAGAHVLASGLDRDGWLGSRFRLDVLGETGGALTLELQASGALPNDDAASAPRIVVARVGPNELGRIQLAPAETRSVTLQLPRSPGGIVSVDFEVSAPGLRCASFLYVDGPEPTRTTTEGISRDGRTEAVFSFAALTSAPGSLTLWLDLEDGQEGRTVVALAEEHELERVQVLPGAEARLTLRGLRSASGSARVEFRVLATDTGEPVAAHSTGLRCRGLAYRPFP